MQQSVGFLGWFACAMRICAALRSISRAPFPAHAFTSSYLQSHVPRHYAALQTCVGVRNAGWQCVRWPKTSIHTSVPCGVLSYVLFFQRALLYRAG